MVEWQKNENGEVALTIPRRSEWYLKPVFLLFSVPRHRKLQLDELGSEVWDLCDGHRSVGDMIKEFSRRHQLNRKETEVAMLTYLRQLAKRRLVALHVPIRSRT